MVYFFDSGSNQQVARTINNAIQPLVISNSTGSNFGNILSLSYLLEPKVRFRLVVDPNVPQIPLSVGDVFLFGKHLETLQYRL